MWTFLFCLHTLRVHNRYFGQLTLAMVPPYVGLRGAPSVVTLQWPNEGKLKRLSHSPSYHTDPETNTTIPHFDKLTSRVLKIMNRGVLLVFWWKFLMWLVIILWCFTIVMCEVLMILAQVRKIIPVWYKTVIGPMPNYFNHGRLTVIITWTMDIRVFSYSLRFKLVMKDN